MDDSEEFQQCIACCVLRMMCDDVEAKQKLEVSINGCACVLGWYLVDWANQHPIDCD